MGTIYLERDVWVVHTTLIIQRQQPEPAIHGSVTTHTGGSIPFIVYVKRMVRLILIKSIVNEFVVIYKYI